jgi:hypothetical protein
MRPWKSLPDAVVALGAFVLVAVAAAFPFSGVARAQEPTTVERLVEMNKNALADYDQQEWESAKETLLAALIAGKRSGLESHPVMARTYVHLGAVYITGLKDRKKGLQSFSRALEIDPTIKIAKAMSTPELEEAFAEAGRQGKPRPGGAVTAPPPAAATAPPKKKGPVMDDQATTPPKRKGLRLEDESAEADLPVHVSALDCPTPDETQPERSVKLKCAIAPNLSVASVVLLYRRLGSEEFGEVEMKKTPKGWYEGRLPKEVVVGKSVYFYFEGRNEAGKPLVSNGRADSPNVILIREKNAAEAEAEDAPDDARDVEENPLEEREGQGPRLYLGRVDRSRVGLDTRYGNRKWWIGLHAGSGFGYAKGDGLETRPDLQKVPGFKPGGGWAGLGHLAPELGWQVTPDFALSLEGRLQWIPQDAKYSRFVAHGALSGLVRALFFTKQSRLRFYGSIMAGGGEGFRFVLYPDDMRPQYKDTVRGGPYLAGAGTGLYYEISPGVSFITELNGLAGFPIFSVVADLNIGLQFNIN